MQILIKRIHLGTHCFLNGLEDMKENICELTWSNQRGKLTKIKLKSMVDNWFAKIRSKVNASTLNNCILAMKAFIRFLKTIAVSEEAAPIAGSLYHPKYIDWISELDLVYGSMSQISKRSLSQRTSEANINKRISERIDDDENKAAQDAIKNMPSNAFFQDTLNRAKKVSLKNPAREQFDMETFDDVMNCIGICMLLNSGQRPEVLGFITNEDIEGISQNSYNDSLYTLTVQEFNAVKKGKTKTQIRICIDHSLYKMILHYKEMRNLLGLGDKLFLENVSGQVLTGQKLRRSAAWKLLGLPQSLTFVKQRAQLSTFFRNNPVTKDINPVVLMNHSRTMQEGPYSTDTLNLFEKASAELREKKLPAPTSQNVSERKELEDTQKQNIENLKKRLEICRGEKKGRANRNTYKKKDANYAVSHSLKLILFRSIFEVRDPKFTYALLKNCPRDTSRTSCKPWTSLVVSFILHERNADMYEILMNEMVEKRVDVYSLCKQVRNTIVAYNRPRRVFEGFLAPPKKLFYAGVENLSEIKDKPGKKSSVSTKRVAEKSTSKKKEVSFFELSRRRSSSSSSSVDSTILPREGNPRPSTSYTREPGGSRDNSGSPYRIPWFDSDDDETYEPEKKMRIMQGRILA